MFLGFFGFISPKDGFEKAMPALERAIAIDDDLDIAHMLMGRLLQDKWDWLGSEAEFRRAIDISPNSAEAHYRYALLLNDLKRTDEALWEVKMAEELDPLSIPVNQVSGTILCFAGKYEDAIERFRRTLDMEPKAALAQNNLGVALFEQGHVDQGIGAVKKALELDPKNMMFRADLCYLLTRAGKISEAKELLVQSASKLKTEHVSPVALAGMNSCLGEKESAVVWLEKALEEQSPYLASLLVERWFDNLRAEPEFAGILRKVGLRK
ncbi:MAG: tetratricopeptide repeat protein [Nitrososphaerota archaeon]|nr:tetratricopeptide repeat protein [Nitrososphaerota archaeon]